MSHTPGVLRAGQLSILCCVGLIGLLLTGCGRSQHVSAPSSDNEWHEFEGTWTAAGTRHILRLDGDRRASVLIVNGSLVLSGSARPAVGFRSEAIVFNDSSTGMIGRAVWTDEYGDQVYSELQGSGTATKNTITGTFVGGTGRYAGVTGTYDFSWRYVLADEEGAVEGQSMGLKGRARLNGHQPESATGAPQT
jgi:hypothetical protein